MKNNGPVSKTEISFKQDSILVSKTDLKGSITYCNQDFIDISGFSESELIGKNHNLVRHPDMPPEAFADLWKQVKAGKPWSGIVKNRAKNGDHYWVSANITPIYRDGRLVEYMSVRLPPSRAQVNASEALYKDIREGRTTLNSGSGFVSRWLNKISTANLLYGAVLGAAVMYAVIAAMVVNGTSSDIILTTLGIGAVFSVLGGIFVTRRSIRPLHYALKKLSQISQGNYFDWVDTRREDEFGQLLMALRSMQTQLGFDVMDAREQATRSGRVKAALDAASANVMIADAGNTIIYGNPSLFETFSKRENALKSIIPDFDCSQMMGKNMDQFHHNPSRQQNLIDDLKNPHHASVTIQDCHLSFTATPIFDDREERIGTVMEWVDLSEQVAIENAVQQVVQGARLGILHQRLETRDREGFFKNLSESINELLTVNETVIGESIDSLSAMASGDLTRLVTGDYQGEFEQLKNNINTSIEQLASMIEQITKTASAVENGVSEIAAGNENLAQRTENQVSALERSASAMEQINGTIQHSANHAMEATHAADNAKRRADDGGAVIGSAIEAMDAIREANNSIQSITDLIDSIAFQTNLLALNAAVEAAHAAGHGQGFGVVASEVRQLAHRTSVAAREVQDLIRNSLEKVEGGTRLVSQSGTILNEIIDQSTAVSGMIEEISNASQEQAAGVKQISLTITQLDQATQENAALVQETSAANQCLLDETRHLAELVERFQLPSRRREKAPFSHREKRPLDVEPA